MGWFHLILAGVGTKPHLSQCFGSEWKWLMTELTDDAKTDGNCKQRCSHLEQLRSQTKGTYYVATCTVMQLPSKWRKSSTFNKVVTLTKICRSLRLHNYPCIHSIMQQEKVILKWEQGCHDQEHLKIWEESDKSQRIYSRTGGIFLKCEAAHFLYVNRKETEGWLIILGNGYYSPSENCKTWKCKNLARKNVWNLKLDKTKLD